MRERHLARLAVLVLALFPCRTLAEATEDKAPAFDAVYVVSEGGEICAYDNAFRPTSTVRLAGFGETYHVCDADIVPGRNLLVLATSTRETPLMAIGIPSLEPDPDFGFPFPRPVAQHMPLYVKCLTPRYLLLCDETFFSPDDPRPYSEALVDLETRSVVPVRGLRNSGKGGILLPPTSDYFVALGSQGLQVVSPASGQILRRVRYPDEGRFEQCVVEADWAAGRLSLEGTWHSKSAVPSQRCLDVNLSKGTVSVILPKGGVPPTASASTPQRDSVMRAWARVQERSHGGTTWVVTDRHTMTVLDKFAAALPKDTEPAFGKIFVSPDDRYIFATHYDSQRGVTMVSVYSAETAEVINSFSCEGGILGVLFR